MSETKNLTMSEMMGLLALLNQRFIRIVRDGYPEQSFVMDFKTETSGSNIVIVNAFNNTMKISMNIETNSMGIDNVVFPNTEIFHEMRCGFDMFLYVSHLMIMLSAGQDNNPMLMLTILPTTFTVIMKIFTEVNSEESVTDIDVDLLQGLLEHTRDIVFDENTSIQSRKK